MKRITISILLIFCFRCTLATDFYVSVSGNDLSGTGSRENPWRTIGVALKKIPTNQKHTLKLSAGTFVETNAIEVPLKISFEGAGIDLTFIKAAKSFYYNPSDPGFETGKFLIRLDGSEEFNGDQSLGGFTIDGDTKQLHGGIYVNYRNNIRIENIKVKETNFCGIWILNTKNSIVRNVFLLNCAWGNSGWCSGALQFANVDHVEFDQLNISESKGYGIKSIGHDKNITTRNLKLHDSKISVNPIGLWQDGKAPNISVEIWGDSFPGCEIFNCYVDNHISLVNINHDAPSNGNKFRIHHNIIDLKTRAKGEGYGMELTIHDAEIDHNIFKGGQSGISNWAQQKSNWSIHHNIFYGIDGFYPTAVINSYNGNLKNVSIFNNTVEFTGKATVNFLECNNGGTSEDVRIQNNLIINSNSEYVHYPNRFINLEKGATIKNLHVENNLLYNLGIEKIEATLKNNIFTDPQITKNGNRPYPYYLPTTKSPLIDAGQKIDHSFNGLAPDIGAYEKD